CVKLLPEHQGRLLHDILRIRHIRHQRRHIAENLPLTAQEQREKLLLGGGRIFEGTSGFGGHALAVVILPVEVGFWTKVLRDSLRTRQRATSSRNPKS